MSRRTGTLAQEVARFLGRSTRDRSCLMGPQRGYGCIRYDGGRISAHRAVAAVEYGQIPDGLVVRHTCDRVDSTGVSAAVAEYLAGGRSQAEVARRHGVSQATLGRWVRAEQRRDGGQHSVRQGKGRTALSRGGLKPCGTKAAYERHHREGTPICDACRDAHRQYMRQYKAERRAAA